MRLTFEIEGQGLQPDLPGGGDALVGLLSFAVSRGFGATHPLIALADRLHDVHRVAMGPLTTFYEADIEDSEDAEKFAMAWQEAGPLARALAGVAKALETDEQAAALARRAGAETLVIQSRALLDTVNAAERAGMRVRLGYHL